MLHFELASSSVGFTSATFSILAYLDPGTGSFAIQILLASLFGATFALKQSWSSVKAWFASTLPTRGGRDNARDTRPGLHGQSTAEIR